MIQSKPRLLAHHAQQRAVDEDRYFGNVEQYKSQDWTLTRRWHWHRKIKLRTMRGGLCPLLTSWITVAYKRMYANSPSVLWYCWLVARKSIQTVKIERWGVGVLICLERGAYYGPTDAKDSETPSSLVSIKSRLVLPFWYRLARVVLEKKLLHGCSSEIFRENVLQAFDGVAR